MAPIKHSTMVRSLLRPEAYPDQVASVELVETHISYLFLTGQHVYKVKKAVDYGFLDFTTREQRRYYCHHEVALNRRLSPRVYLGVVEVKRAGEEFSFGGSGDTVDYAVKMVQLPKERAMTHLLQQGRISEADIRRLAVKIGGFHRGAETGPEITHLGDWAAVDHNISENFQQTERFVGTCLAPAEFDDLRAYSRAFLDQKKGLFDQRAAEGRIKDGHGDLHTAQIFLENGISIIDCIEFNNRFRYSDVAEDIAFLAMDLDYHHRPDLSQLFVLAYIEESEDDGVVGLLDFFKVYRAYVRGKVNSFRLDDAQLSAGEREQVLTSAQSYFRLAHSYLPVLPEPALILVCGLTGTGKSTVALELARRWDLAYISSDITRKELAGVPPEEHQYQDFARGIYSPEFTRRTYQAMLEQAKRHLAKGRSVVMDGTFRRANDRRLATVLADEHDAGVWMVECVLPPHIARRRLDQRVAAGDGISDGRWEIYQQQRQEWESVKEVPEERHLLLDTSGPLAKSMRELLYRFYCSFM
jgi:hypothetical protein